MTDRVVDVADMSQADIADRARAWCLLPLGALEGHGPHLPLGTDSHIASELAHRAAARIPGSIVLPCVPYGMSWAYRDLPLTVSLSTETLTRVIVDVVVSAVEQGFRKILVVNGHDGNIAAIQAAAAIVEKSHGIVLSALEEWWVLLPALDPGIFPEPVRGHAGEPETSIMLVSRPATVRLDLAQAPASEPDLAGYGGPGVRVFDRIERHYPGAAFADARRADAEKGLLAIGRITDLLVDYMRTHDS